MTPRRVDLGDGQYADLATVLNHAQWRRIVGARGAADAVTEGTAALLLGWLVRDVNGSPIEFPADVGPAGPPASLLDRAPSELILALADVASLIAAGRPDPLGTAPPSPDLPAAPPSE